MKLRQQENQCLNTKARRSLIEQNIAVIGAGPGGYVAAIRAAQLDANVFLIEDREVGGEHALIEAVSLLKRISKMPN